MSRRVSVGVAAASLIISLAACGNATTKVAPSTAASTTTTTVAPTTTAATTTTTIATTTTAAATTTTEATTTTAAPATTLPVELVDFGPNPVAPRNVDMQPGDLGLVEIPRIGLRERILEGIDIPTLDNGAGHWPGSAMAGDNGNLVLAGHRTSHTRPFRYIDKLVEGDEVFITMNDKKFRYVVTGHEIVTPDAVWIVDPTPNATATLFACHPPGQTTYRWVTRLEYRPT
jgi:sortase A